MRRTNRNRIVVEGDRVLRFPVTPKDKAALVAHAGKQQAVHDAGLPVPAVLEIREGGDDPCMVMERVPGIALIETELSPAAQVRLADELAVFLQDMWAIRDWPPAEVDWVRMWEVLADVVPCEPTRRAARAAAQAPMRLTHGDLSGGNLMVDDAGHLLGVLDWDEARTSDPAMDWSALCANVPARIAARLRAIVPDAAQMDARADCYLATWGLQNELWESDRHPWILGETPFVEPRV